MIDFNPIDDNTMTTQFIIRCEDNDASAESFIVCCMV